MTTVANNTSFVLKGCNPADFALRQKLDPPQKGKHDILHAGKVSHTTGAGGIVRVLQRGNRYDKNGNPYETTCTKQCWWHRKLFDTIAMGIPMRAVYKNGERDVYMDGSFCSYSCVLAFLEDHLEKEASKRNPNYSQSITLLKQLFEEEFPGEELIAALDWTFQKDVGNGDMTTKDYMANIKGVRIIRHPNLSFKPVTVTYDVVNK